MHKKNHTNNNAFTLGEAIVVIIVVSSFMVLAVPRFATLVERLKVQEQTVILQAVHSAALEFFQDNQAYTNDIDRLDVEIPPSENFTLPDISKIDEPSPPSFICDGDALIWLAAVDRIDGSYTLFITEEGKIYCDPCGTICSKLGFPASWS